MEKEQYIEVSFLPKVSFTRGHLDFEYGWVEYDSDKNLIFTSKEETIPQISIAESDVTTMDDKPFYKKFVDRTKEKRFPVKHKIDQDILYFIVPGDNYVLDSQPLQKNDIVILSEPKKIYKNKRHFIAGSKVNEIPEFETVKKLVVLDKDKVILSDLNEKKYWNPEEQRQEELKLAKYEGLATLIDKKTKTVWGYELKDLSIDNKVQKSKDEVKTLANEHKISNMKLVDKKGTIFLQGIGCEITNFPQKWKE